MSAVPKPGPDRAAILAALAMLFEPGSVVELRALHKRRKRTDAGFFDSAHWDDLADAAARLSAQGAAVYVTLNPVDPGLLSRYNNRIEEFADSTTTDAQVLRRRWLLIDLDPVRPAKTSATDAQLEGARVKARAVCAWLKRQGWPAPVVALSGNGFHLLYALDLPNDDESTALVKGVLQALADRFDDAQIKVDRSVFNAARIVKIYGTLANKGDNTAEAPWRLSKLLKTPARVLVTVEQLRALQPVVEAPAKTSRPHTSRAFNLEDFLSRHGMAYTADQHAGADRFKLATCPFNAEHTKGQAAIFRQASGVLGFKCQHNSCAGKTWKDVRLLLDGPAKTRTDATRDRPAPPAAPGQDPAQAAPELLVNNGNVPLACEANACLLMAREPRFAGLFFDDFLSRPRIDGGDWLDAHDLTTMSWLQTSTGVARFSLGMARNGAKLLSYSRRRDSLRDFVDALPAWDGVDRLAMAFYDAWGADDTPVVRAASANFFIALIARAMKPGAQVDTLWVFEGAQGTRKSAALRVLGGDFHAEVSAGVGTADFQRELQGLWIIELSELDSLRGKEASTIKRLLSAPSDRFVQKYALHAEAYPRRAVAVATTNEAAYWQDPTGARRLIPVQCTDIDLDRITALKLQWFAEAKHRYTAGEPWWEFPDAILDEQETRQQVDPWEDTIAAALELMKWPATPILAASISAEWLQLLPHQQGLASGKRIAAIMRSLGFVPVKVGRACARAWQRTSMATGV
jgi:Virulence-associated protein E